MCLFYLKIWYWWGGKLSPLSSSSQFHIGYMDGIRCTLLVSSSFDLKCSLIQNLHDSFALLVTLLCPICLRKAFCASFASRSDEMLGRKEAVIRVDLYAQRSSSWKRTPWSWVEVRVKLPMRSCEIKAALWGDNCTVCVSGRFCVGEAGKICSSAMIPS